MTNVLRFVVVVCAVQQTGCERLLGGLGGPNLPSGWTVRAAYPCGFNRTDALHVDTGGTLWTGCGTNTEGTGLYTSVDNGDTWLAFSAPNAPGFFDGVRVNTISRSADGFLYVGGTGGDAMVVRVDPDSDEVEVVLEAGDQVGTSFSVGSFRRDSAGRAIAESLTGVDALSRGSDDDAFVDHDVWANIDERIQILDVALDGDTFVAVGSTIAEPNTLFVETPSADVPIAFEVIELSGGALGFPGELRGVAAHDGVIVAGGVDEDSDQAVLYVKDGAADAVRTYANAMLPDLRESTIRGACASPGHFVVVGEEPITNGLAFVLHSTDGETWQDLTMPEPPAALTRCVLVGDVLTVAGGDGYIAQHGF